MDKTEIQSHFEKLHGNLDEFKTVHNKRLDTQEQRLDDIEARFATHGLTGKVPEQNSNPQHTAAILNYLRKGEHGVSGDIKAELSVHSDPEGGYFVNPDMTGRIVEKIYETSPMRQVANVTTTNADAKEGLNDLDEASAGWVGETESRTETDTPDIGEWRIPIHEMYAEPRATQKQLEDADRDVESWLEGKLASKFGRMENTAFVSGDGIKKPRGFLDHDNASTNDDSRAWGTLQFVTTGNSGDFAASDSADVLYDCLFKLKANYLANAVWMMARSTMAEVAKLKDGQGNYLLTMGRIDARTPFSLLGYPVFIAEDMPAIASNSLSIAFGDFNSGYQIVDRRGITILRDPYTAKGKVKLYSTKRVGGDLLNSEAIKLIKFGS